MEKLRIGAVIPAAGIGTRMRSPINKQYLTLRGKPILSYAVDVFEACPLIDEIVVVIKKDEWRLCKKEVILPGKYKKVRLVTGGETRQDSVFEGLNQLSANTDIVLIHDGARPFIDNNLLLKSICETYEHRATVVAVPAKNTIKVTDDHGFVEHTPNRRYLYEIQTPQTFDYALVLKAYNQAKKEGRVGTDDASLVEWMGEPVKIVEGNYHNLKITTPEDMVTAEAMMAYIEANHT